MGRISPGPTMWPPGAEKRLVPAKSNTKTSNTSDFFYLGDLEGGECYWTNERFNGVLLIQCRHSGYIQLLPCNANAMTGKAAAKWCAQTWMGCWDVPSEILTDSGSEYIAEWRKTLCSRLGIHHLLCEVHQHRALPPERTGKTIINMLQNELASDKDVDWLEILFAPLCRYHTTEWYHGYSPNQLFFGRIKCWWNLPYDHPRECKDALPFFDEIQAGDKEADRLIDKVRADGLSKANRGRNEAQDVEKETVFGSARTRIETQSSSPCGKVPLKRCLESGRTVLRCVRM